MSEKWTPIDWMFFRAVALTTLGMLGYAGLLCAIGLRADVGLTMFLAILSGIGLWFGQEERIRLHAEIARLRAELEKEVESEAR